MQLGEVRADRSRRGSRSRRSTSTTAHATDVGYLLITGETDINVDDLQRGRDENSGVEVEEAICAALAGRPRPSREVKAQVVAELACGKRTVERDAVRMAQRGEFTIASGGFPRTTTWALASDDNNPPHSCDDDENLVATSTNARRVATASSDVVTGDSASSSDSGDCLQSAVPAARQGRWGAA